MKNVICVHTAMALVEPLFSIYRLKLHRLRFPEGLTAK